MAFFRQTTARESSRNGAVFEIYIADGRGRIVRNLSRGFAVFNTDPAWSPNGKRLAFTAGWRGSVVAVVRRISGRPRVLVPDAFSPEWSPDGTKLAFATEDGIYTIRPNGSDRRLLVEDATDPDFSADGQHLAFVRRTATGRQSELYVAKADGSDARQLTHSTESESDPAWSPDGKLIAFTRWDADPRTNRYWVIVIRSDTGEEYAVIRGPHSAFGPTWRPAVSLPRANRRPCR